MPNHPTHNRPEATRRGFFHTMVDGIHGMASAYILSSELLGPQAATAASAESTVYDLKPKRPHIPPKAKAVIQLFMNGGPSQVDLLDPKPTLGKFEGRAPTRDLVSEVASAEAMRGFLPSPYKFAKYGSCGMDFSELLPHTAQHADELALIRSMYTETPNHEPALFLMHSGRIIMGRPSLGAWVAYGLGTENQNLPAYVVLDDPKGLPINGIFNWQSAWLPPIYQGTRFRSEGPPVLNLAPRPEVPEAVVAAQRDLLRGLDHRHMEQRPYEPDVAGRMASYELAARMQLTASDALDLSRETEQTKAMYGLNDEISASYGKRCLMARRLVERGVRFVQIYIEQQIWDAHADLDKSLRYCCGKTDRPTAALLTDLRQRGLLDSTLVAWCGEFGRLPLGQAGPGGQNLGRDHGASGFSVWLAGGGVKGGTVYGATDELGHKAVENRVSVHDFHATILRLLGMNYRDLVYPRHGLDERLTDQFPARVVSEIVS